MAVEGWSVCTLGDAATIKGGTTPSTSEQKFWTDGDIPWATPTDITALGESNNYISDTKTKISSLALLETSLDLIPPGNVLMTSRATIGLAVMNAVPITTNQGFANFFPDQKKLNAKFLVYWLRHKRAYLEQISSGSTFLEISKGSLKKVSIDLPSLSEQKKIAEILGSVDQVILKTKAVITQTQRIKHGLLQILLTEGIGHTKFKQTDIGEIPTSWNIKSIKDLCSLINGHGFKPHEWKQAGLPIIRIQNLNGSKNFNYFSGQPEEKWIVEPGQLLFAWAGVKGVSFGPCIWHGEAGVLNQHIFKIHPNHGINKIWLYETFRQLTKMIESKAHGFKASLLHVKRGEIENQLVAVPSEAEQLKIGIRIQSLIDQEKISKEHLRNLVFLKKGLMSDLLTGRVRVNTDKNKERAA